MNTYTGEITRLTQKESDALADAPLRHHSEMRPTMIPIDPANLSPRNRAQLEATGRTKISRNSPCACGSRKRFKRCCMTTISAAPVA